MAASTYKPKGTIISSFDDSGKNKLKSIAFPVFKEFKTTGKVDAESLIELAKNNNLNLLLLVSYIFDLINKLADVTTNKIKSELSALADAIVIDLSSNKLFDVETFKAELTTLLKSFSDEAIEKVVQKIDELKEQFSEHESEKEKSDEKPNKQNASDDISEQLNALQTYISGQFFALLKNVLLAIEKSLKIQSLVKPNKQNASDDISEQLNALQTYISGQFFALLKNVLLAIEKSLKIQSLVKPNKQKKKEQATLNKTLDKLNKFMDNFFDNLIAYVKPFVDKLLSYAKMIVNKLMTHIMAWILVNVVLIGLIFAIIIKLIAKPLMEILQPILDFISGLITKLLDFLTPIRDNILIPLGLFVLTILKSIFENVLEPFLNGIGTVAYALGAALGKLVLGIADFIVDVLLPFLRDRLLPVLGEVLDIIKELLLAIKPWIKPLVDVILKILFDILKTVGTMFEILAPVIVKLTEFIAHVLMDILNEIKFAWDKVIMPIIKGINTFLMIIVNIGRYIWAKLRSVLPKLMGGDGGKSLKELENEFAGAVEEATDKSLKGVNATMDPELMSIQTEIAILIRLISNGELFVKLANTVVDTIQKSPLISNFIKSITEGIKKFTNALKTFVDKIDPIIKAIAESITKIAESVAEAIEPLAESIADAIEKISDSITLFIDELRILMSTIMTTLTNAIVLITTSITTTINDIRDAIIKSIETLTEMVRPITTNLANAITEIKDSIVKSIDRITTGILELPGKIFDKIMAGIKAILNVGKMVKDAAVNAGKAVLGGAKNLWNKMTGKKEEVKLTPDQMFEKILAKIDEMKSVDLVSLITETLQNIITTTLAASLLTVTATLSTISTTISTVTLTATELATLVSVTIQAMLTTVLLSVQGIVTSLVDLPMNLAKGVTTLVSGITGTITDLSKGVYDTVSNTVEGTAKTIASWFSFGSDKVEVNPPKIDKVVLNTADVGSINGEVTLDKQDDKKTTIDDVNQNVVGIYDFLKPFADATRLNFELILLKLDEKPNLLPIPFSNTDVGNAALMENM